MNINQILSFAEQKFASYPMKLFFAPGRINLIGEHLDYNGGFVLPCTISLGIYGAACARNDNFVRCYSENVGFQGIIEFALSDLVFDKNHGWANYVKGMLKEAKATQGFDLFVYGNLPNGAGLSSSAALEILIGTIINDFEHRNFTKLELAMMGQRVENQFIGVQSGIMDQFVIAHAQEGKVMLLDTAHLTYDFVKADFSDYVLVIGNTNKRRTLSDSKYNERRNECIQGLKVLQKTMEISHLCEVSLSDLEKNHCLFSDERIFARVKHVVSENERVKLAYQALQDGDIKLFGKLLNASHQSLKVDYQVTGLELDSLVSLHQAYGAIGARMTGAGFGGCMLALMPPHNLQFILNEIKAEYEQITNLIPDFYLVQAGKGVS